MAWFNDPRYYYREAVSEDLPLSQGDIVIAATAVILPGEAQSDVAAPTELDSSRHVVLWHSSDGVELPAAPPLSAEVRWGLAMVLPHPCALEKDWQGCVKELTAAGMSEVEAIAKASKDPNLDPVVAIAPVLPYNRLASEQAAKIASGNGPLGTFPVVEHDKLPPSYVDFSYITTVRWELLSLKQRLSALSELAAAQLRYKLALYFAFRAKSTLKQLEAAVGQRIVEITTTPKAKRLSVGLILEDGSTLTLEGDRREETTQGIDRPVRRA